jgi:hypothetical protein
MMLATSQTLLPPSGIGVLAAYRIGLARKVLLALPWLAFLWQLLLAQSSTDVICALLAALGGFLVLFDAFRLQRLLRYPLSTLVILGFAVTLQLGPSLFTAIEGHSLTYNLQVPVLTFMHSLLVVCGGGCACCLSAISSPHRW